MVEIELPAIPWPYVLLALAGCLVVFALLGAAVTPTGAQVQVMTLDRWAAAALAREAHTEVEALLVDASELRDLLDQERPDPVAAMLLAERLYARHSEGTSATGGARQALIAAAEATARYATGELSHQAAANAFNGATVLIETLVAAPQQDGTTLPAVSSADPTAPLLIERVYLPHIQIPGERPVAPGRRMLITTIPEP